MPNDQNDLFGWQTRARSDDPPTSKAAAKRIMRSINEKHHKVQEIHRQARSGLTDWELEEICGDHGATYRTRRQELSNPQWFNPPFIVNSFKTKRNPESDHPGTERIIWIWAEYADPYLSAPKDDWTSPAASRPTNASYDEAGRLVKNCATCGAPDASHGFGVSLLKDQLGMWYCDKCKPNTTSNSR